MENNAVKLKDAIVEIKECEKRIGEIRTEIISIIDTFVESFREELEEKGIIFFKTEGVLEKYVIKFKDNPDIYMGFDIDSETPEKGFFISFTLEKYTREFIPFEDFTTSKIHSIILSAKVRLETYHLKKLKEIHNMI